MTRSGATKAHFFFKRSGQAVLRWGKNFLRWRVRPIAQKTEIPESFIIFQVMRRTLGTNLQHHGTLKDAQGCSPPREHPDDGRCLHADDREQRAERDELPNHARSSLAGKRGHDEVEDASTKKLWCRKRGDWLQGLCSNWTKLDQVLKGG